MKVLAIAASLLLLAATVQARLGETRDQCTARYGKPVSGDDNQLIFEKEGLQILINFYNGKADYLAFSSAPRPNLKPKPLSDEDIARLLEKNRGNDTWAPRPSSDGRKVWIGATRYAEVNAAGELVIMAQDVPNRLDQKERPKPVPGKDRLKDF